VQAPLPPDEEERLKALRRYEILDTDPEQEFDDITLLASHICGTPIAMISLIDEKRQWFKSKVGMTDSETSRDIAFCAHGILEPDLFVIEDALADERFASNPLVTGNPKIRFYAGSPLVTHDGHALGMLCVNDRVPRELSLDQKEALRALARQVVAQLESRRSIIQLKRTEESLQERTGLANLEADVGTALTRGGTLAQTLRLCSEAIVKRLDAAFARFWTLNEKEQVLELQASAGLYTHLNGPHSRVPVGAFKIGLIASERKPHLTNQVVGDPRVGDQEWAKREGMVAFAGYPLLVEERVVGVVAMFARHKLTDVTLRGLASISNNIALGIERKRAETAVRESEEKFRQLAENITDVFWIRSPDLREVHYVSPAYERTWGRSAESLYANPHQWADAILPEDRERVLADFATLMGPAPAISIEYRIARPDGEIRWVHVRGFQVRDAADKLIRLTGIVTDITERKVLEAQMERLRTEHTVILNSVGEGVHWIDADGRIRFENPAAAKMLGYEVSELIGKPAHPTMHHTRADGTAYPQSECCIYATLRDGVVRRVTDEVFWRKDGTSFAVEYICTPVYEKSGRSRGSVVIFNDITSRKLSEAELEKTHKQLLETSRRAGMAEVATSVLHNVGNVLNSVNVAASCLADSLRKSKAANLSKVVTMLREHEGDLGAFLTRHPKGKQLPGYLAQLDEHLAGEQAVALKELAGLQKNIEHIKDIVAMQQSYGKVSGVTETMKIADLVEDALRMNAGALTRHDVQVIRDYGNVPPVTIDKHKVLQVLVNLIRNAKQACAESGRLDKQMTMRVANGGNRIRISISDNGVGIPAENLTRIFNHGFTTRKDGHGFGLHSGALAAMEMGGSLTVHSDGPGQGAAFTLELPRPTQENITDGVYTP
jgi:PAS domain S-box-containing protein